MAKEANFVTTVADDALAQIRGHFAETGKRLVVFLAIVDDPRGAIGIGCDLDDAGEVKCALISVERKLSEYSGEATGQD